MMSEEEKENIPADETGRVTEFDGHELQEVEELGEAEALAEGESEASSSEHEGNSYLRQMMEQNFIEYASYVIKERAIPDVDDGLKPVQRRILWSLFRMHDGKFHKVANVIGHCMQYHPHGDASIGGALVVLANKEYFIDRQGNFGNIYTGDVASAARYIECRLSPLGLEVLFNDDITEFVDSYDGRNREPVVLPVKIPSLLMLGTEGIAVGMSTRILPHNFCELLEAQISVLRGEKFALYPDFQQGGSMDVSEYEDGNGKIKLRAKIELDGRRLVIREIPAVTTTESLIASIERVVEKNKIKVASINDYTAEKVEIEIVPTRGQDPAKMLKALYTYTDCSVSVSCNMMVIRDGLPVQMEVSSVIRRNTEKLLDYLHRELEIELARLEELFHAKTLAQIFIENRIYKRIEECDSFEKVMAAVYAGLEPFRDKLKRDVSDDDVQKLLAIPIRRISLFDIRKNQTEIAEILSQIEEVNKNLGHLKKYAVNYLKDLLKKYGGMFPRRTEIEQFKKIDPRAVALNNIKVGWDRKNCYIGTNVKSEDVVTCNEFDHLLCIERKGNYRVINIPDKIFIDRLYDFRKFDDQLEFGVIYKENKNNKYYVKRTVIDKFIVDKTYRLCPKGCRLEMLTPRSDSVYTIVEEVKNGTKSTEINLKEYPVRSPKARGLLLSSRPISKITHLRYLTEEELAAYADRGGEPPDMETSGFEQLPEDDIRFEAEPEIAPEAEEKPDKKAERKAVKEKPEAGKKPRQDKAAGKPGKKSEPESQMDKEAETETAAEAEPETEEKAPKPEKKTAGRPRQGKKPETKAEDKPVPEKKEESSEPEEKPGKAVAEKPGKEKKVKTEKKPEIKEKPEPEKPRTGKKTVKTTEPEAEKSAEDKTAPETEKKTRKKKAEPEKSPEPEPEPEPEKKAAKKDSKPETGKKDSGGDNEWGIVQPEFGF